MSLQGFSKNEINTRIAFGDMLIGALEGQGGPEDAIKDLRDQQRQLREELARREGTPPPVVIGLKTAHTKAVLG